MQRLRALNFLGAILVALLRAAPVQACTPPPGGLPAYTTAEYVTAAPLVFEGTVMAVSGQHPQYAAISVSQYIKGIGPQTIAVSGYGPSSVCLSEVFTGQTGLFLASGDEASGYSAFYLSQFDAVLLNDTQTLADAIAASGQAPRTDFTPYTFGTPEAVMTEAMSTAFAQPTPFPFPTVDMFAPPFFYATETPSHPTPMPPQMVSALDAVSAAGLLMLGGCVGLLAGALAGGLAGYRMGRRK